jgi:hypothetical protein
MKRIALSLFTAGLLFAGCKKEATIKPVAKAERKIKSLDYTNSAGTDFSSIYSYDSEGRLKEIRHKNETEMFTYNSPVSFSVKRVLHADPAIFTTDLYTLNNKGAAEKMETLYANGSTYSITRFSYNPGNILQAIETEYPMQNKIFRFEYSISNNIRTSQSFFINTVLQSREEYSYDMSRSLKGLGQLIWNIYFPGLYGADQKYPLSGIKFFDATGNLQESRSYTSVLDEEGYMMAYTGNDLIRNSTFTYQINY